MKRLVLHGQFLEKLSRSPRPSDCTVSIIVLISFYVAVPLHVALRMVGLSEGTVAWRQRP